MSKRATHCFNVLITERSILRQKKYTKQNIEYLLIKSFNDINITSLILDYIYTEGVCNKCDCFVKQLHYHKRYKNICTVCIKKYKP